MSQVRRRVVILFNPVSGSGKATRLAEFTRQALAANGHDVVARATERGPAAAWLTPLVSDRDVAVVAGGDGAMRMAVGALAEAGIAVWHLPAGTENLFARAFGMIADPRSLLAALDAFQTRRIDLAEFRPVDGDVASTPTTFSIMASIGFDAAVIHDLTARRSGAITHFSYLPAIARTLRSWRPSEVTVELDGGPPRSLGPGVLILGNLGEYAFRIDPVRFALPDDGLLDGIFLPATSGLAALAWGPKLLLTRTILGREVVGLERFRAASVRVRTGHPALWQADGDPVETGGGAGSGFSVAGISVADVAVRPGRLTILKNQVW
ncbi:MAG: NAD(+)/NADH kinase [Phycisphaerae bacterium]|nr:NAD(+)/NADH kinase [Phycisphaerae bacterium]